MCVEFKVGVRVRIIEGGRPVYGERVGDTGVVVSHSPISENGVHILFDRPIGGWDVEGWDEDFAEAVELGILEEDEEFPDHGAWILKERLETVLSYEQCPIQWID